MLQTEVCKYQTAVYYSQQIWLPTLNGTYDIEIIIALRGEERRVMFLTTEECRYEPSISECDPLGDFGPQD